jgi:Fe-S cluster assembly protein SufB
MANEGLDKAVSGEYALGFEIDIETDIIKPGLDESTIAFISKKKEEPEWMLELRLKALKKWKTMTEPHWAHLEYEPIDYQSISYYAAPKQAPDSLDEVDPKIIEAYEKLGIPIEEQKQLQGIAVDVVVDSVSVTTTYSAELKKHGVIFCSISDAIRDYPELVKKYMFSVVPMADNYFAALNSAVFTDGTFVYIPKGVRCPMELSTYFRINALNTGQFERTLIIADEGSHVSYNEGCSAPTRDEHQLHAAVVELVILKDAEIKYSTIQNWYPGDMDGKGGIYNFVTKRAICEGDNSKVSWTQVETGSAITWKYPSCILKGDNSVGEFYSVAVTTLAQQADTGTKMIHIGKNTSSTIISKGISAMKGQNTYRGLVKIASSAVGARNYSECDSLLIGPDCGAHTFPYLETKDNVGQVEHEATTSKISDEQLFYLRQRGVNEEDAVSMIVHGFCKQVFSQLPMEYAVEAKALLELTLEGSVG